MIDIVCQYPGLRGTYVYYCRTYEKAVSGEEGKERTCAKDTTSRGVRVRVRPPHTIEWRGGGEVVSKEVGEEESSQGGVDRRSDNATSRLIRIAAVWAAARPTLLFRPL